MKRRWAAKQSGFTLVELLIVIVVIAILASISVVAYSGIQDRAKRTSLATTLGAYQKGMELYRATHGTYPALGSGATECLGVEGDLPATANHPVNRCGYSSYVDLRNDSLNNALSEFMAIPNVTYSQAFQNDDGSHYRGVYYEGSASYYYFEYVVDSSDQCPIGTEAWSKPGYFKLCFLRADA